MGSRGTYNYTTIGLGASHESLPSKPDGKACPNPMTGSGLMAC
jgi:hypothetical protein